MFWRKRVFRNLAKFIGKHLCQSLFLNKVTDLACNFLKKQTLALVFSCEFHEISQNTFFTEHIRTTASQNGGPEESVERYSTENHMWPKLATSLKIWSVDFQIHKMAISWKQFWKTDYADPRAGLPMYLDLIPWSQSSRPEIIKVNFTDFSNFQNYDNSTNEKLI